MKYILAGAITVLMLFLVVSFARATAVPKITWCHTEPNGNQQTLELPQQALENAGHVNAQGNPLHAGDHAGECVISPTPTTSVTPTPTTEPSVTPTPTDIIKVTETPTPVESRQSDGGDGLGCASHPCTDVDGAPLLPPSNSGK